MLLPSEITSLDKEYNFTSLALTQNYLKKKIDTYLTAPVNSQRLVKEIYYAKYRHPDLLKNIVAETPAIYYAMNEDALVIQKKLEPPFLDYMNYISPLPAAPVAKAASNMTASSFQANWNTVSGATSYTVTVGTISYNAGLATNFTVTNLTAETTYTYTVKAHNASGASVNSNSVSVTTTPIISNGLVAYYPFNGNANDMSGNGNHPTYNTASLTSDRFGYSNRAYSFTSNRYISIPDSSSLSPFSQITVTAWVYQTTTAGYRPIVSKGYAGEYALRIAAGSYGFADLTNTSIERKFTPLTVSIPANSWTMMTMVYNGSTLSFYKNGTYQASVAQSGAIRDLNSNIMIAKNNYPEYFTGSIDDVRIYNRALSSTEITQLYQSPF